jgi:hypothetical protein
MAFIEWSASMYIDMNVPLNLDHKRTFRRTLHSFHHYISPINFESHS